MKKTRKIVVLVSLLAAMSSLAVGQGNLKEIVEQEGLGWMVNEWKAVTDDGQAIELTWKWAADGNAISTAFKMGEVSSIGLLYMDAAEEVGKQLRVDNQGRATEVAWEPQYDGAIAKTQYYDEYGQSSDIAYSFSRASAGAMKLEAYGMQYGEPSGDPLFETTLKPKTAAEKKKKAARANKAAYGSLKEILEEEGFTWMVGRWTAATDDGQKIDLAWKWAADGQALASAFKMGENASVGVIYLDADAEVARQLSVDNQGRAVKTIWEPQYDGVLSKTRMFDEYGEASDVAVSYSKAGAAAMKVAVYGLNNGELSDNPWFEGNFEKKKARTGK